MTTLQVQLSALYALQQIDRSLDALRARYAELDTGATEEASCQARKSEYEAAEAELHAVTAELRDAELEQKSVETKRADYETRLYSGTVTVPKELKAMQDEIDMLARQRGRLDETVLALMDRLEAGRTRETGAKQAAAEAEASWTEKRAAYEHDAAAISGQARQLSSERDQAALNVPAPLLKRYDGIRAAKRGLAIVAIQDRNLCGGCKMGLPSNQVTRVNEGAALEMCENCGRILCLVAA